jgi:hypothetical protein
MIETGGALQEVDQPSDEADVEPPPSWLLTVSSPAGRRTITGLGVLGLAVPVIVHLWFIHHYSVNVLWGDTWSDINVIGHAHAGNLNLATLWAQHFENRMFFPNLIVIVLADVIHFNVVGEEYVSAAMLIAATGILILTHRHHHPTTPWLYYCPVAILMFSLVGGNPYYGPSGNTLWGFQMAWYLVLLGLAAALFLLDRPSLTWPLLAGAMAAAVVGSFSSLQGLLIWPAGLVLLYLRRRSGRIMVVWVISAIVTALVYFYNFDSISSISRPSYLFSHPFSSASFFLFSVGNNVAGQEVTTTPTPADLILGTLMVVVAVWLVIACGLRRDREGGSPLGVSLICFGLLFTAMVTAGRAWLGYALVGRYAAFELLVWVGCYLALLDRTLQRGRRAQSGAPSPNLLSEGTGEYEGSSRAVPGALEPAPWRRREGLRTIALLTLITVVLVQALLTTKSGIADASAWYQRQLVEVDIDANIDKANDALVQNDLGADVPAGFIRQMTAIARSEHLSLFDTPLAAQDARRGLFPYLQTSVLVPTNGAVVSGTRSILDAGISVSTAGTKIRFRITGGASHRVLVVAAKPTPEGWVAYWNTTTVANGTYVVHSVVVYPDRARVAGAPISVTVENKGAN